MMNQFPLIRYSEMTNLPALVTAARKGAGYATIYAMATATGLPLKTLSDIERGISSPSIDTLARIMDAIDWKMSVDFKPRATQRS